MNSRPQIHIFELNRTLRTQPNVPPDNSHHETLVPLLSSFPQTAFATLFLKNSKRKKRTWESRNRKKEYREKKVARSSLASKRSEERDAEKHKPPVPDKTLHKERRQEEKKKKKKTPYPALLA